ncbi:MAG: sigma 54-interacting transcriptional regulator, partial [Pseudacidovorax sp.]|nr:sigma 54-interacting transcriptional regulator [Pseudacidovorax sp.]
RDNLIRHLGMRPARALLTQVGYLSGVSDAEMLRRDWPDDYRERSRIGTRFHGLAGIAKVEPVKTDFRPDEGYFRGEFLWRHTVEDDAHIKTHGLGTDPACWMELGYATGYLSTICGQLIVFREIECRSMGSEVCRVLGRPASEWGDVAEDLSYLGLGDTPGRRQRSADAPFAMPEAAVAFPGALGRDVVGESAALKAANLLLGKVAPTRATVLITGESGTGKELFARVLHEQSKRSDGPFVAINCAAIPENLLESELFGVARGGFTGAVQNRAGRFERAAGGTLFLDEIGTLSMAAQAKLLRVLQEQEVERVGATSTVKVDARIVAATNVSLREAVARGEFREDLFYRLNVFPIHLPPLRERRDDIPALVTHFMRRFNALHDKSVGRLTGRAMQALLNYRFPGNIRELENLMERAVILTDSDCIDLPHLISDGHTLDSSFYRFDANGMLVSDSEAARASARPAAMEVQLEAWAQQVVDACQHGPKGQFADIEEKVLGAVMNVALERSKGNVAAAARMLGMKRHQLEYRLKAQDRAA